MELYRGSWNIALAALGVQQALSLGRHTEGQWSKIYHSDLGRTTRTAKCIQQYSPEAELISTRALRPMHLGSLEGKEITRDTQTFINQYSRAFQDKHLPGISPKSGEPGDSLNSFLKRLLTFISKTEKTLTPGEKIVMVSHYRDVQAWRSWLNEGEPKNFSVDIDMFCRKGPQEPGSIWWLDPEDRKLVESEDARKPGLYIARHGKTSANA